MSMPEICLVHLVRKKNGVGAFRRFLDSYTNHEAGAEHDLLLVFKGFGGGNDMEEYDRILEGCPHKRLFVWDYGFDIRPYSRAVRKFDYKYFCFLNSFSVILDDGWLGKMHRHITREGVGLVGATGSYQGVFGNLDSAFNAYLAKRKNKPRNLMKQLFFMGFTQQYLVLKHCLQKKHKVLLPHYLCEFPNYHIRTNAFMMPRTVFLKLKIGLLLKKKDAYMFESSMRGLTRQVSRMRLESLVVGRDGKGYAKDEWFMSNTFWRDKQQNLLVADNQTIKYIEGDNKLKSNLSICAWGDKSKV